MLAQMKTEETTICSPIGVTVKHKVSFSGARKSAYMLRIYWHIRRQKTNCLRICKTQKAVGNCKPSADITAGTRGQGSKSQIDLNQVPGCR